VSVWWPVLAGAATSREEVGSTEQVARFFARVVDIIEPGPEDRVFFSFTLSSRADATLRIATGRQMSKLYLSMSGCLLALAARSLALARPLSSERAFRRVHLFSRPDCCDWLHRQGKKKMKKKK
jgi:hypothetical protein